MVHIKHTQKCRSKSLRQIIFCYFFFLPKILGLSHFR